MKRTAWLRKMRRESEEQYDTRWAPLYGEKWGLYSNATHQQFVQQFLGLLSECNMILDAACGAGRYLPPLLEKGHTIIGIDQSQGMLARAKAKFPDVQFEKIGLQEMNYQEMFDGVICMDAMEHVCPEDWPLVLGNFHQALKQQGYLYFTVEIADDNEVKQAFNRAQQDGLPVVYGEWPDEVVYHYYPAKQQVKEWLQQAGFELLKEGDGDDYYHLIVLKEYRTTANNLQALSAITSVSPTPTNECSHRHVWSKGGPIVSYSLRSTVRIVPSSCKT